MDMTRHIFNNNCSLQMNAQGLKLFRMNGYKRISFSLMPVYEFALQVEGNGASEVITSHMCREENADRQDVLCRKYYHELVEVSVSYRMGQFAVYKQIDLVAKKQIKIKYAQTELSRTEANLTRGGEGQPIFVSDAAFVSIMFPAAQNVIDNGTIRLEQAPYVTLAPDETFSFYPIVYGFNVSPTLEESFARYIECHKKETPAGLKIYCDWAAHDEMAGETPLDEAMAMRMLDHINQAKQHGADFNCYLMDAYWFKLYGSYQTFNPNTWPNGPEAFCKKMKEMGISFGLWFDVNLGVIQLLEEQKKLKHDKHRVCFSYEENAAVLFDNIKYQMEQCDLTMLKLDFAFFDCADEEHSVHACGGVRSKEPAIRNFLKGMKSLYEKNNQLVVLGYNGFTTDLKYIGSVDPNHTGYAVSPWWCLYLDYIYCGDPRPSECPALKLGDSLIYYTDAMVEKFAESLVPYYAIDDHGTMVGNTNTIYYIGKTGFRDSWIMNLSRGGRKMHLYGELGYLDDSDWEFIHDSDAMFAFTCKQETNTEMILGKPSRGQVYGYSNSDGYSGYITVVNPTIYQQNVCLSLSEWADGDTILLKKVYYRKQFAERKAESINKSTVVTLEPNEVAVYYWDRNGMPLSTQEGYFILDAGCSEIITFCKPVRKFSLQIRNEQQSPQRIYGRNETFIQVHGISDGVLVTPVNTKPIWSGCSWMVYDVAGATENTILEVRNTSNNSVSVQWMER